MSEWQSYSGKGVRQWVAVVGGGLVEGLCASLHLDADARGGDVFKQGLSVNYIPVCIIL